jgi:hypothetical protein
VRERVLLLDWLSYLAAELLLRRNTLHLAVSFLDDFLRRKGVAHGKLQALGAGALLLAVKQEERGSEACLLEVLSN